MLCVDSISRYCVCTHFAEAPLSYPVRLLGNNHHLCHMGMVVCTAVAVFDAPDGDVHVLLALAKSLDPTSTALPKRQADNTKDWCKEWLAERGCSSQTGRLWMLDISQAGLNAAAALQGTLPQQLPGLATPLNLTMLSISGPGIIGSLPPWVLQVADNVQVTDTSIMGPLPSLAPGGVVRALQLRISANPWLSGTLPASWATSLRLRNVDLSANALTGTLPDTWSESSTLEQINLAGNKLSGSLSRA